jgi:MYXO-CTERM domain-containing protein
VSPTLWLLGLAALAAAAFWLRRQRERSRDRTRLATVRRQRASEEADLDRRDCRELEASLSRGAYGDRSQAAGSPRRE